MSADTSKDVNALKQRLRREALDRRRSMSTAEVAAKSAACLAHLDRLPVFHAPTALLAYAAARNELDTLPLLQTQWRRGRLIYLPRLTTTDGVIEWVPIDSLDALWPGPHGILTPRPEYRAAPPPPDALALVPCLLFNGKGHRLGHGGGHFDRFLAAHTGFSIALAYAWQQHDSLPVLPHDRPVNLVVTEEGVRGGTDA